MEGENGTRSALRRWNGEKRKMSFGTWCHFDVCVNQHAILDLPWVFFWKLIFLTHFIFFPDIFQLFLELEKKSSLVTRSLSARSCTCETDSLHSCTQLMSRAWDGLSVSLVQDLVERDRVTRLDSYQRRCASKGRTKPPTRRMTLGPIGEIPTMTLECFGG